MLLVEHSSATLPGSSRWSLRGFAVSPVSETGRRCVVRMLQPPCKKLCSFPYPLLRRDTCLYLNDPISLWLSLITSRCKLIREMVKEEAEAEGMAVADADSRRLREYDLALANIGRVVHGYKGRKLAREKRRQIRLKQVGVRQSRPREVKHVALMRRCLGDVFPREGSGSSRLSLLSKRRHGNVQIRTCPHKRSCVRWVHSPCGSVTGRLIPLERRTRRRGPRFPACDAKPHPEVGKPFELCSRLSDLVTSYGVVAAWWRLSTRISGPGEGEGVVIIGQTQQEKTGLMETLEWCLMVDGSLGDSRRYPETLRACPICSRTSR